MSFESCSTYMESWNIFSQLWLVQSGKHEHRNQQWVCALAEVYHQTTRDEKNFNINKPNFHFIPSLILFNKHKLCFTCESINNLADKLLEIVASPFEEQKIVDYINRIKLSENTPTFFSVKCGLDGKSQLKTFFSK